MTFPFFPTPVENETIDSVVTRFLTRQPAGMRESLQELGMSSSNNSGLSISVIRKMVSALPSGHPWIDVADILQKHTVIPLFLFFDNEIAYKDPINDLIKKDTKNNFTTLGMTLHSLGRRSVPRYCSSCVAESNSKNGYSTYIRNHQIPFVKVCSRHREILRYGCRVCGYDSVGRQKRHMAGRCDCKEPTPYFTLATKPSEYELDSLVWVAKQIDFIFDSKSSPIGKTVLSEALIRSISSNNVRLFNKAFRDAGATGIADRLISRFTAGALNLLDCSPYSTDEAVSSWVRNCIAFRAKDDMRSDPFKLILLSGLVYGNLSDIPSIQTFKKIPSGIVASIDSQVEKPRSIPKGYGLKKHDLADSFSKSDVSSTLKKFNFNIDKSASTLSIRRSTLISLAKHFRVRIPLSNSQLVRIGTERIQSVRQEIKKGTTYLSIMEKFSLNPPSLDQILLDDPNYYEIHRAATIANQRISHRNAILKYSKKNIGCTGDDIRSANQAAFDWVHNFDSKWWSDTVRPILDQYASQKPITKRSPRKDWNAIDNDLSVRVRSAALLEYQKDSIPLRLTINRLVQEIGYQTNFSEEKGKLPKLADALQELCEDMETYYKRRLSWALNEVHRRKIPMSMNQFRRIAKMPAPAIMKYLPWVNQKISDLKLGVDARSCFSTI